MVTGLRDVLKGGVYEHALTPHEALACLAALGDEDALVLQDREMSHYTRVEAIEGAIRALRRVAYPTPTEGLTPADAWEGAA